MNFPLIYSLVFGGITAILYGGTAFIVPDIAVYSSFTIWIGGLAVYYLLDAFDLFLPTVTRKCQ